MSFTERGLGGARRALEGTAVLAVALLSLAVALSCGSSREVILRTAAGAEVTAEEIDRQPLWLLPPGGIGWFHIDVARASRSDLGREILTDLEARLALPDSAGFSLGRDISELSVASYSMQGVDFAGVARGQFDKGRIAAAAVEYRAGALPPLTRSEYAGRTLFLAARVGFVIVTPHTALFGNEIAIRRCLDRIAESRVSDDLPSWTKEMMATPNATFSIGLDLKGSAVTAVLPNRLAALRGASMARAVGNFDPPGINIAGTITHVDHDAARASANGLLQAGGTLNMYGRLFGLGQPIQKLETRAVGNDTQLVLGVDGAAVQVLMKRFLPPPPTPRVNSGPGWAGLPPSGAAENLRAGTLP
jgi:hypothetical protein